MEAFHDIPPVISPRPYQVDLLVVVLAYVASPEATSLPVEGEAPRIAKTVGPHLPPESLNADEGVIRWYGVVPSILGYAGVYAEDGAQKGTRVLSVALMVSGGAAVAEIVRDK